MASTTAADVLTDVLADWGVDTVFGLPGDEIIGIIESRRARQDSIRSIQLRQEESGNACMSRGYAKYTGRLSIGLATRGAVRDPTTQRHA